VFGGFKVDECLGIVYPQFWMRPYATFPFSLHFSVIKKHYCELKWVKLSLDQVVEPLNVDIFDM
jgi:hypothetical protein